MELFLNFLLALLVACGKLLSQKTASKGSLCFVFVFVAAKFNRERRRIKLTSENHQQLVAAPRCTESDSPGRREMEFCKKKINGKMLKMKKNESN